jgi:hypothetical protein
MGNLDRFPSLGPEAEQSPSSFASGFGFDQ